MLTAGGGVVVGGYAESGHLSVSGALTAGTLSIQGLFAPTGLSTFGAITVNNLYGTLQASALTSSTVTTTSLTSQSMTASGAIANVFNFANMPLSNYNENGWYPLFPWRYCVIVPHGGACSATTKWVRWDTEDSGNADGGFKDGIFASDQGFSGSIQIRFCCFGPGY
jgi:hypothetical protein